MPGYFSSCYCCRGYLCFNCYCIYVIVFLFCFLPLSSSSDCSILRFILHFLFFFFYTFQISHSRDFDHHTRATHSHNSLTKITNSKITAQIVFPSLVFFERFDVETGSAHLWFLVLYCIQLHHKGFQRHCENLYRLSCTQNFVKVPLYMLTLAEHTYDPSICSVFNCTTKVWNSKIRVHIVFPSSIFSKDSNVYVRTGKIHMYSIFVVHISLL